jgi:5-methylcytosine-specific restriction endonuclease McrA
MKITKCRGCGSENLVFVPTQDTIHYGKMICGHCKMFSHWIKNPESPRTNTLRINSKTIQDINLFHKIKEDICFFCLRDRKQLGSKETMTIDHIIELDKGGEDQIWNMQILCSACHKLKNWARLYMNWHFNKEDKNGDTTTT